MKVPLRIGYSNYTVFESERLQLNNALKFSDLYVLPRNFFITRKCSLTKNACQQ